MSFTISSAKGVVSLFKNNKEITKLTVSKPIDKDQIAYSTIEYPLTWKASPREKINIKNNSNAYELNCGSSGMRNWTAKISPDWIIFPTREGELISNPQKLRQYQHYNLSYPGTASTKCVVVGYNNSGFLIGARPSLLWSKISLTHCENNMFLLSFLTNDTRLFMIPFSNSWEKALDIFRKASGIAKQKKQKCKILSKKHFLIKMGVRDFFGKSQIKSFSELTPFIEKVDNQLGKNSIIHLFGTNKDGFDRMFPDYTIDKRLGGEKAIIDLNKQIHKIKLLSSHHFNPRIADARWLEKNKPFKSCVVKHPSGNPWVEFYKGNVYFIMDPSNTKWQNHCIDVVKYFRDLGFDYVQLDQVAYQRNLYTGSGGFGPGYQELIDKVSKLNVLFWLEGVSDIYDLPEDCFFQILPRDRPEIWETDENRRGYPYGKAHTRFFRNLKPDALVSFQIVTEKHKAKLIRKRLAFVEKINAQVYDLELGFIDKTYKTRLNLALKEIVRFYKNNEKPT